MAKEEDWLESKDSDNGLLDEDIFYDINSLKEKVNCVKEGSPGKRQIRKPARYMA